MAALTVRMIEAIKPRDKPFKVTIDRGLHLRVASDGRRTLLVRYSVKGYPDERQYSLPREYGDGPGQIKVADAKAEAARIRALARDGIDWPEQQAQERQKAGEQRQLAEEKKPTFAQALLEYAERKRRSSRRQLS
jgi:Arm DNA-binding domain